MNPIILNTEKREIYGKKLRSLRKKGILPIHVYGPGMESIALQSETNNVLKVLQEAGRTNPVKIIDSDKEHTTLVRNVDQHPATGELQHVDFMRVDENKPIEVEVPVVLIGEAPGTRGGAGTVTQAIYSLSVLSKPFTVPSEIQADLSVLVDLETNIKRGDLVLPDGVELVGDPDIPVAWIQPPRVQEEVAVEEGAEEGAEEGEEQNTQDSSQSDESGDTDN
ncbi:MAG: general stress protein CTC [Chloroflexota bacterium]|nr:MAG: general stress protein CTC [Chloroflexota bacterium]